MWSVGDRVTTPLGDGIIVSDLGGGDYEVELENGDWEVFNESELS